MIDKNVDTPPTVENLYKEGYLTEHVKTARIRNIPLLMKWLMAVLQKQL